LKNRPLTKVTYELELIGEKGEFLEEFSISFDSELYDNDAQSTDAMTINFRMEDFKLKYGDDILLLSYSVDRDQQIFH
jgi:hypothetical protein